jgi:GNAT superfamily N-acetyltransferase
MSDTVCVRDLRPGETETVERVFEGLSANSRYLRFHAPVPRLTASMRAALADVRRGVTLVAVRDGVPLGIARLIPTGPGQGELAVEVVDAAQRRGVGTALVHAAVDRAAQLQITTIQGSVLRANRPMLSLLKGAFRDAAYAFDGPAVLVYIPASIGR